MPGDATVGLRFASDAAEALRAALQRLLSDNALRARLSAEARDHVLWFDWSRVACATAQVYGRALADQAILRDEARV